MTTKDKLRVMDRHAANNRQRVEEFLAAGITHVTPSIAGKMLGCTPYSLNVAAQTHRLPPSAYYFAGRNCRISLHWLASQV